MFIQRFCRERPTRSSGNSKTLANSGVTYRTAALVETPRAAASITYLDVDRVLLFLVLRWQRLGLPPSGV